MSELYVDFCIEKRSCSDSSCNRRAMRSFFVVALFLVVFCAAEDDVASSPRIIIVGAGPSGIAAASKLVQNGFDRVKIIEAEDRFGGRVHTVDFAGYPVDLGGQWVHGQVDNVVYDLAAPLGLLENGTVDPATTNVYTASGERIDPTVFADVEKFYEALAATNISDLSVYKSLGDFYETEFRKYFDAHPEINGTMQRALLRFYNVAQMSSNAADTWSSVALDADYHDCEGSKAINWRGRAYGTVLDILMKSYPNPEEELPVRNSTILNAEVTKIDYTNDNVKVTANDEEYLADHVIFTPSLGVLKATYETMFEPALPEKKIKAIKAFGFGSVAEIYLAFEEPWWNEDTSAFVMLWSDEEAAELKKNDSTKWYLGLTAFFPVEHKPRLLLGYIASEGARDLETISDESVLDSTLNLLRQFLSKDYNVTEPTHMIRTKWFTNKHFRGTYSYKSPDAEKAGITPDDLAEPIMSGGKPVLMFAGEATNRRHYSTVHGAIESGWREADRLIAYYSKPTED